MNTLDYLKNELHYPAAKMIDNDHWMAICPFIFTHAIIVGSVRDVEIGYDDRWCYHSYEAAKAAFDAWDGTDGEPDGWHRHPHTGRRREGDREWVNP